MIHFCIKLKTIVQFRRILQIKNFLKQIHNFHSIIQLLVFPRLFQTFFDHLLNDLIRISFDFDFFLFFCIFSLFYSDFSTLRSIHVFNINSKRNRRKSTNAQIKELHNFLNMMEIRFTDLMKQN